MQLSFLIFLLWVAAHSSAMNTKPLIAYSLNGDTTTNTNTNIHNQLTDRSGPDVVAGTYFPLYRTSRYLLNAPSKREIDGRMDRGGAHWSAVRSSEFVCHVFILSYQLF